MRVRPRLFWEDGYVSRPAPALQRRPAARWKPYRRNSAAGPQLDPLAQLRGQAARAVAVCRAAASGKS